MIRPAALAFVTLLLMTQCSPNPGPAKGGQGDKVDLIAPPPTPYGFELALTLSPAARTKLTRMHEEITVAAMYYGEPGAGHETAAGEDGQIDLGKSDTNVPPSDQTVHVTGGLDPNKLTLIKGEPMVLVNVYTARKVHPDNLLDCGIFEDVISKARAAPVAIACKLIEPDKEQGGAQ